MKFSLGKNTPSADRPLEEETLKRWRAAAMKNERGFHFGSEDPSSSTATNLIDESVTLLTGEEQTAWNTEAVAKTAPVQTPVVNKEPTFQPRIVRNEMRQDPEQELARRFGTNIKTAIGPGTVMEGKLSFESPVRIDGILTGEVNSTSTLIVGSLGKVDAKLRVGNLIVLGQITGDIEVEDLIEIKSGGQLEADILVGRLVIDEGGIFEGQCTLRQKVTNLL